VSAEDPCACLCGECWSASMRTGGVPQLQSSRVPTAGDLQLQRPPAAGDFILTLFTDASDESYWLPSRVLEVDTRLEVFKDSHQ
jgi:hypothetical protein